MKDDRRQYRTPSPFGEVLSVAMRRPEESEVPGTVVDVSIRGLGVLVEEVSDPAFEAGEVIHIHLTSPRLDQTLITPGRVRRCSYEGEGTLYGIQFLDWLGILSQLPPELKVVFNQRNERRLGVRGCPGIDVEDPAGCFRFDATLRDVSLTGLCFTAPKVTADSLEADQAILVTLTLPGSSDELTFCCRIRNRQSDEERVCVNACFVEEETEDFPSKREKLAQLVRQIEHRARKASST